jgi:CheY-like chemotaxis protein
MTRVDDGDISRALTVLVVEDHEDVRAAFAEVLRDAGFSVATAADGREGFTYLQEHGASMVFLDLKMPVIDGISFIQLVRSAARSDARMADVSIVVITADRPRLLPPEIRILRKPCSLQRLIELARATVPHSERL